MMGLGQGLGLGLMVLTLLGGSALYPQYLLSHTADEVYLKASQTECTSRFSTSSEGVTLGTVCQWDTYGSDELSRVTKQENPGFRNALATLHFFQATVPLEEISYAKHPSPVTVAGPVDL